MPRTDNMTDNASSTGQAATASGWLDIHFESFRPEYEACLRMVAIESGWHVLDAGCGSGMFLPLLAQLVGREGQITAIDLAPENVNVAQSRVDAWNLDCTVRVEQASLLELPYPNDTFDAVWIANVLMYLSDEELEIALGELTRVVRSGGLICAKEVDGRLMSFSPAATEQYMPVVAKIASVFPGGNRGSRRLPYDFERAGLQDIWRRTELVERWSPLADLDHQYLGSLLQQLAGGAAGLELSIEASAFWEKQHDPTSPEALINHPDFAFTTSQLMVVGAVPASS